MKRSISERFPFLERWLIAIREIDARRIEEVVPQAFGRDDDAAGTIAKYRHLANIRWERDILRQSYGLTSVRVEQGGAYRHGLTS